MRILLVLVIAISCSSESSTSGKGESNISKPDIEIIGLKNNYSKTDNVNLVVINNLDKRVSFHLEGLFYAKSSWGDFDNDLLSKLESKTERDIWLEQMGRSEIEISPEKIFTRLFNTPDSFQIRVAYRIGEDHKRNTIYSNSFTVK